ncbi:hypothetical protein [Stutzerimonas nitrititolerans]
MLAIYWVTTVVFFAYLLIFRRYFDFLSVYTIFLVLFSLPVLFGVVFDPYLRVFNSYTDDGFVFLYYIPYFLALVAIFAKDILSRRRQPVASGVGLQDEVLLFLCMIFSIVGFLMYLHTYLSVSSKSEFVNSIGIVSVVYTVIIPFFAIYSFLAKKRLYFAVFLFITFLMFLMGSRRAFAIFFVALFLAAYCGHRFRLRLLFKVSLAMVFLLLIVILGKSFYSYIYAYGMAGVAIWFDALSLDQVLLGAEFMATSAIAHSVYINDYSLDFDVLLLSLYNILPVPTPEGGGASIFNDHFQPDLFPGIRYGMAYNPWAEAYSIGRYVGVFLYSVGIISVLLLCEYGFIRSASAFWKATYLILGVYFLVWVHRNSLGSQLAYIRNFIYPIISFSVFAGLFLLYMRSFRAGCKNAQND